jgi:hypothetical protein
MNPLGLPVRNSEYRKLPLTIKNFLQRLKKQHQIDVKSEAIKAFGLKFYLHAITKEQGFLRVYLRAEPFGFVGNRMEIDWS